MTMYPQWSPYGVPQQPVVFVPMPANPTQPTNPLEDWIKQHKQVGEFLEGLKKEEEKKKPPTPKKSSFTLAETIVILLLLGPFIGKGYNKLLEWALAQ